MSTGLCQPNTTPIPDHLLDRWLKELSPSEFKVMMTLFYTIKGDDFCVISDKSIAQMTGFTHGAIKKFLRSLETGGWIKRETTKNGVLWDRKIYILACPEEVSP